MPDVTIDDATRAKLARGETIITTTPEPGCPNPRLTVMTVLDAPPARAWAVIDDVDSYGAFMPRVKVSKITSRGDDGVVLSRSEVAMPFPLKNLKADMRAVHTVEPDQRYERRWSLVSGDYKRNDGGWVLTPFEGDANRTLLVYDILVVPKMRIPKTIASAVQERAMPEMMDCVRKRVRQLG